jgi:hypothetical protein
MPIIQVGGSGSGGAPGRTEDSLATASLAASAEATGTWDGGPGACVVHVASNVPGRLRLYASAAQQTADQARAIGVDPVGDHGCLLDVVTDQSLLSLTLSPAADVHSSDGSSDIYYTIQNLHSSATIMLFNLTYVPSEA